MSNPVLSLLKHFLLRRWTAFLIAILLILHLLIIYSLFHRPEARPYPPPDPETQPAGSAATTESGADTTAPGPQATSTTPRQPRRYSATHYHRADTKKLVGRLPKGLDIIRSGVVIDLDSHAILWAKDENKPYPMASITKLMTAMLLLDRIEQDPQLTLETTVKVTPEDAKRIRGKGGVYLSANETFTLQEYLKCMLIKSANDCAYVVARFLGQGDPDNFVQAMNRHAADLGLDTLRFHNPHGLPIDKDGKRTENQGSALQIAYLAECATQYPEIMKWAGTPKDCIRETGKRFDLHATNHLLRDRVPGITGLKTGFTNTAGHCIVITCTRNQRTILVLVMGVQRSDRGKARDKAARDLLEWAFKQPADL